MSEFEIRPLDPETDAPGIVEIIHELVPHATTTVESWRQQYASVPDRARRAAWVAHVDGVVAARAEASLNWFSQSGSVFAGVSVGDAFRRRGIGSRLWELTKEHVQKLQPRRIATMFLETPEGVAFARKRGFEEVRAETLSSVDPRTVDLSALETLDPALRVVALGEVRPEDVYEVDVITTPDVPMTDELDDIRYDEWLETFWRRPTMTLDGSFGVLDDDRLVCITMLSANLEHRRAFNEYTGTLSSHRGRGLATLAKLASLRWAAANGITAVWTTNDETNAAMLGVNERLGYRPGARRVEYERKPR